MRATVGITRLAAAQAASIPRSQRQIIGRCTQKAAITRTSCRAFKPVTATLVLEPSGAPPPARSSAPSSRPINQLGQLLLQLLPGPLYYTPVLLYPLSAAAAGLGAVYAPAAAAHLAALPAVQALGPLGPLLAAAASPRWAPTLCLLASLLTALMAFVAMPLLDLLLGPDPRQPDEASAREALGQGLQAGLHRAVVYSYVPVHLAMLCGVCYLMGTAPVSAAALAGATLSAGVAAAIQFLTAHELVHGCTAVDRGLGNVLLATVGYMHWAESHLAHHVKVATPEDPASARRGESLWAFIPRSVWGNLVDGYSAEAARLARRGIPLLSLRNRMVWWIACPTALAAAAYCACGWRGLAFAVGQAALGILFLECVNYVEHYGLQRQKLADGRYERCGPQHSWDTSFLASDASSFRLQRHADHHQHGSRPYHLLRNSPESPRLPFPYSVAILLALVPPLHRRVMDPLLDDYAARQQQAAPAGASGAAAAE